MTLHIDDCYSALKVIHHRYQSLPKKFHDFINTPKGNGYRSLHTVILGPKSQKLEVQIRTTEMHQVAQYGSAAHWQYKHDCTKILSVFIAAQKLYTKPTVNLTAPNSVTQHNNSKVNINITATNTQQNTIAIHMNSIGLLATDNNQQTADDKIASDDITSQQVEHTESYIKVQPSGYSFMNILFKFMQDNVYDQIMIFIVGSDIANLVDITVDDKEHKVQKFWNNMSYASNNHNINGNKQNKNSKHVFACSKKEVLVISSNFDVYSNLFQMLVGIDSTVTENIDIDKATTLTKIESNSNTLNSEQTPREEKQDINSIQDIFSTTLQVNNISDNITNITNITKVYEHELQDEGAKSTNDSVQYFQLPFNERSLGKDKESDTSLEYSSANYGNDESAVVIDSDNRTTNFENNTSSTDTLLLSNNTVDNIDNHKYVTAAHIKNKGTNSTNMISKNTIKLHRHAAKIFCAIVNTKKVKEIVESIMQNDLTPSKKDREGLTERPNSYLLDSKFQEIHTLLNSYESISPENIDSMVNSVDITPVKNEKYQRFIGYISMRILSLGPQPLIGNALVKYFSVWLQDSDKYMIIPYLEIFTDLCNKYLEKYIGCQNVPKFYQESMKAIESLKAIWHSHAEIEIKGSTKTHDSYDNESDEDKRYKFLNYVNSGNFIEVYNTLFKCSRAKEYLSFVDEGGNTPILVAINRNNFPMVMLLLLFEDCNLNVENNNHQTPLSLAFTSLGINKCMITILIHEMIIKDKEKFSIKHEKFYNFIRQSKEFEQFYNACRSYVENFSSIMIIDLLVEMGIISPELMKNLVVGLYYKSYINGDDEFREYFKCIRSVDIDVIEVDCEMMIYNYYSTIIEPQFKAKSTVLERYNVTSLENMKKILKSYYILQQSKKQLQIIDKTMTQYFEHLKIEDDTKLCNSKWNVDYTDRIMLPNIDEYITMVRDSIVCKNSEKQEILMKYLKCYDESLLKMVQKIVKLMKTPIQQCKYNSDNNESIANDASALHNLCKKIVKVNLLAQDLIALLVNNDKNTLTECMTKKYEAMLKSIHKAKELYNIVNSFTDLRQKDLHLLDINVLPTPPDTKILPEYPLIKLLRTDPMIIPEDRKFLIQELRENIANDVDDISEMDNILSYVAHEIGMKNADSILVGEQHDNYNDHDNI